MRRNRERYRELLKAESTSRAADAKRASEQVARLVAARGEGAAAKPDPSAEKAEAVSEADKQLKDLKRLSELAGSQARKAFEAANKA
ncbi:MAG: hypothetical protein ACI89X_003239 [Planctomycetota bacterium]